MRIVIRKESLFFFVSYFYFVSIYISRLVPHGNIAIVLSVALLFFAFLLETKGTPKLYISGFHMYMLLFGIFILASSTWAVQKNLTIPKFNNWCFTFIAMLAMSMCIRDEDGLDPLLRAIMYGGYSVILCVAIVYGWSGILSLLKSGTRIDNEVINANSLGMCAAMSVVINVHYVLSRKLKPIDILIVFALVIVAASGSRKALIMVLFGVLALFVLKNSNDSNTIKKLGRFVLAMLLGGLLVLLFLKLPMFVNLRMRMRDLIDALFLGNGNIDHTNSAWIRIEYNKLGMRLFRQNPVLGIGIGNANIYTQMYYNHNHYLHNNYVELLACGGIVGFSIYYSIYTYILWNFWKCREYRNKQYDICLTLLVLQLIMDYGCVTYFGRVSYIELLLFWTEIQFLNKIRNSKEISC